MYLSNQGSVQIMDKEKIIVLKFMENCVTVICTAFLILGLYFISESFHSLWGLLLLSNINKLEEQEDE